MKRLDVVKTRQQYDEAKNSGTTYVNSEQLKQMFIESGLGAQEAEFQVTLSKTFGPGVLCMIDGKLYGLREPIPHAEGAD